MVAAWDPYPHMFSKEEHKLRQDGSQCVVLGRASSAMVPKLIDQSEQRSHNIEL
jgi:hypothetical protein